MLTSENLAYLAQRGITAQQAQAQLERFAKGFPYLKIKDSARVGEGITSLTAQQQQSAIDRWKEYLAHGGEVTKFVPASGAASRMFKALFEYADGNTDQLVDGTPVAKLIAGIDNLPFTDDLDKACKAMYGQGLDTMLKDGRNRDVIRAIVSEKGMNYGQLPKGLLKFHKYADGARTPLEEHLTEGAQTAANSHGIVNLHFTVSANHRKLFEEKLSKAIPAAEARTGMKFNVSLSEQKPSTDTLAANPDNTPFIENGHPLLRPGGHGALIENLADIDSAVVFIKNIDNVVPDSRREDTIRYKQILGGYLIQLHDQIEQYLITLNEGNFTETDIENMLEFMRTKLCIGLDDVTKKMETDEVVDFIRRKLSRPVRVCGMVRNEGEPGGGPFLTYDADGTTSPQILESHQVDTSREEYKQMMAQATHFNPVDLVCYIKTTNGQRFDLPRYVDAATGFISSKSSHGKELRALELPGLWNGAMSDWNTAFVEVPVSTFNPVKTVNDLLRPAHQG